MSVLSAVVAGLLRAPWYIPLTIAVLVYPLDLALITYFVPAEGERLFRPSIFARNVIGAAASAYLIYGALYSFSLFCSGALPIKRPPPKPPEELVRLEQVRRSRIEALRPVGFILLSVIGTFFFMVAPLSRRNPENAIVIALAVAAFTGAALLFIKWATTPATPRIQIALTTRGGPFLSAA